MTTHNYDHIHSVYCTITNRQMPCSINMHFAWEKWHSLGWTEDDLKLTVRYISELIRKQRRRPESFRFNNLIMDTDRFSEDLAEAKAHFRGTRADPGKVSVLRATHRPVIQEKPPMPVRDVMKEHAIMAALLKGLKDEL